MLGSGTPLRLNRTQFLFQSTRPRGARHGIMLEISPIDEFQSTRPRGARLFSATNWQFPKGFNPRARGGRDFVASVDRGGIKVSIHAPAGGATQNNANLFWDVKFQSTRPRGARHYHNPFHIK